jgi:UTP--glucose-1-phosphate uridylyltransferase
MTQKIRKAVIPVAGLGTRVLPASKVVPKELLNVFDRPILSYVVEEAFESGIEHIVFINGRGKGAIEDYFDHHIELEHQLETKGKTALLHEARRDLKAPGSFSSVRQMAPLGLGHAIGCAKDIIGDEAFAILLPDMILDAQIPALAQAIKAYEETRSNIIIVEPVSHDQTHLYGVVDLFTQNGPLNQMRAMVEKPAKGTAPSNLIVSGRYILRPEIFAYLEDQTQGAGGEIQLTDAMARLMQVQEFYALEYEGTTYDCGDKIGLLRANINFGMKHPELGQRAKAMIKSI